MCDGIAAVEGAAELREEATFAATLSLFDATVALFFIFMVDPARDEGLRLCRECGDDFEFDVVEDLELVLDLLFALLFPPAVLCP
mmetsp:Transcript_21278/g.53609  ORF Transcript_21278/g.53609 Transcript_21278/m.53609 type:complete len:85 (+) Transcript_21278:1000-1254(+)|eukprot:g14891.t1